MSDIVFYSWQSDLPNSTNRGFIEDALRKAALTIKNSDELEVEPTIDRDTSGVTGSPDIAGTIFRKIDNCKIFVADVSIINKYCGARPTPNPNILIELGYAIKTLGWEKIMMVMNTAYGQIEVLPFDLRSRRITTYSLPENHPSSDEKGIQKKRLQAQFEAAFREMFKSQLATSHKQPDYSVSFSYETKTITQQRHDYKFSIKIKNISHEIIRNYHIDLEVPRKILNSSPSHSYGPELPAKATKSHRFFRVESKGSDSMRIFPGDEREFLTISYFIDNDTFDNPNLLNEEVRLKIYIEGKEPTVLTKPLREFQKF